jgi:hypothetical protein
MKLTEVKVSDATLTRIGSASDDGPVITERELRGLRELWRQKAAARTPSDVLLSMRMLERMIETMAIGISHERHTP